MSADELFGRLMKGAAHYFATDTYYASRVYADGRASECDSCELFDFYNDMMNALATAQEQDKSSELLLSLLNVLSALAPDADASVSEDVRRNAVRRAIVANYY